MCHRYLFLLLFSTSITAQINITGRVVDEKGDHPISAARVYFNNTTIGTTTDKQGRFNLDSVNLLNTEMVIACAGYETLAFTPTTAQIANKKIIVKLTIIKKMH